MALAPSPTSAESLSNSRALTFLTARGEIDRYTHGITAMKGMAGRHIWLTITARATRQR